MSGEIKSYKAFTFTSARQVACLHEQKSRFVATIIDDYNVRYNRSNVQCQNDVESTLIFQYNPSSPFEPASANSFSDIDKVSISYVMKYMISELFTNFPGKILRPGFQRENSDIIYRTDSRQCNYHDYEASIARGLNL